MLMVQQIVKLQVSVAELLPGHTRPLPRKQPSRTSLSGLLQATVSYGGGMYPGRGQMSSTGADDGRAYSHARHLILMRYISALYK